MAKFSDRCSTIVRVNREMPAGLLLVITALIITAPLCNQLFSCGCTWPWSGLDSHCNYHIAQSRIKCPWCNSTLAATLSLGTALALGYWFCMSRILPLSPQINRYLNNLIRYLIGIALFIIIAAAGGLLSATHQAYPLNQIWLIG